RHLLEPSPSQILQKQPPEMPDAADPDMALCCLTAIGLQPFDETFQVICRETFPRHDERSAIRQESDRLKIGLGHPEALGYQTPKPIRRSTCNERHNDCNRP